MIICRQGKGDTDEEVKKTQKDQRISQKNNRRKQAKRFSDF